MNAAVLHALGKAPRFEQFPEPVPAEGEVVVNSEHRQAVQRIANGFAASGVALDGVVEGIEFTAQC